MSFPLDHNRHKAAPVSPRALLMNPLFDPCLKDLGFTHSNMHKQCVLFEQISCTLTYEGATVTGFRCSGLTFSPCPLHSACFHMAKLLIVVTVQVLHTPVCSLQTSSNVNSLGKGETLLIEKALLREFNVQAANESVTMSVLQGVPKFTVGSCLEGLRYILRYRFQRFLISAMEMKSLFDHQWTWLLVHLQRRQKILERLLLWLLRSQKVPQESVCRCLLYAEEDDHLFLLRNIISPEKEVYPL